MIRITRRDVAVALGAVALTCSAGSLAQTKKAIIGPSVWDWNALPVTKTDVGEVRSVVDGPTATLDQLEMQTLGALSSSGPATAGVLKGGEVATSALAADSPRNWKPVASSTTPAANAIWW